MAQFCKKNQNSCLLIFLTTRTHNTWPFPKIFKKILSVFFFKTEKAIQGGTGGGSCGHHLHGAPLLRVTSGGAPSCGAPLVCLWEGVHYDHE
jgi:hypothetical protein